MMKVAALFSVAAADVPLTMPFSEWQAMFGQTFNGDEMAHSQAVYEANVAFIEAENSKGHSYTLGVNQFSALTEEEFIAQYTGANSKPESEDLLLGEDDSTHLNLADAVDWTTQGVVNKVKDQGSCGSCWAFSAVGTLESAYAVATGKLENLAEQQLVDCDKSTGNQGCNGGWPYDSFKYYESHGACTESSYAYKAKSSSCKSSSCTVGIPARTVTAYQNVQQSDSALKAAVAQRPISVTVQADSTFQSYRSGVLNKTCIGNINHAIIAVGYSGTDYFKVRNSWGSSWGEQGYGRLAQGAGSGGAFCLLKVSPVYPVIPSGPTPTPVPAPAPAPTPMPTPTPTPTSCNPAFEIIADSDCASAGCGASTCATKACFSPDDCCTRCLGTAECNAWTFRPAQLQTSSMPVCVLHTEKFDSDVQTLKDATCGLISDTVV